MNRDFINLIAWLLIGLWPVLVWLTAYAWQLHGKSRRLDQRKPKPWLRLSLVMAFTSTIALIGATILMAASASFLAGRTDLAQRLGAATVFTYVIFILVPIINAGYLRFAERGGEEQTPRPS